MNGSTKLAIRWLAVIIVTALGGIVAISLFGIATLAGIFGDIDADSFPGVAEALNALSTIGATAIGGLVGWLTRDVVLRGNQTATDAEGNELPEDVSVFGADELADEDDLLADDLDDELDEEYPDPMVEADPEEAELPDDQPKV